MRSPTTPAVPVPVNEFYKSAAVISPPVSLVIVSDVIYFSPILWKIFR